MKKLWTLMAMAVVFASCSQDETASPLNTYTLTGYADVKSRTAFGDPSNTKIPFLWSADDRIDVEGMTSVAIAISNEGKSATFTFNESLEGKTKVYYNMTGSNNQAKVVTTQTVGDLGANGDFGYGTISDGSFTLKHATSYLWFNVTSSLSNVILQSIKVSADDNIAGKATWNESLSSFEAESEGSKAIELTVNQPLSSTNSNIWAMVVLPNLASKTFKVTYKLKVDNVTKYCSQTVTGNSYFISGKTLKVSLDITDDILTDYAELRYLTFEDADAKFPPYYLEYADATITTWSDLIDDPEFGGPLNYYDYQNAEYTWYDKDNTELTHTFPHNYNAYCFWGGGHAISNYASTDYVTNGAYENQLTVYGEEGTGGHKGSSNFCMHFGYIDGSPWNQTDYLPALSFGDDVARVIDHMYVNNSTYAINCYMNGNGLTANIGESDWVKLLAIGYDANNNETGTLEFYMVNGPNYIITQWTKWDLSALGKVLRVEFNITGSSDNGYGYSQPAYFAYDDVAVQFE